MSFAPDPTKRRLLPRWHSFARAVDMGELRSSGGVAPSLAQAPVDVYLDRKLAEWNDTPSVPVAVDVLSSAVALGVIRKFESVGWWLLRHRAELAPAVVDLAELAAHDRVVTRRLSHAVESAREMVSTIRRIVTDNPRDAVLYSDLALCHAVLGNLEASRRAMVIATQLAPDNRHVLRAACRFWIHYGDPEHARALLLRSPRTRRDPWLAAAELAVSSYAGKAPRSTRAAAELLDARNLEAHHLSELAGAMGTLEALDGNRKRARTLFAQSLEEPTENAVAQAVWAMQTGVKLTIGTERFSHLQPSEAMTWHARMVGDWEGAISACRAWLDGERFSKVPPSVGSFMSMILGDFEGAKNFADLGLEANPEDFGLYNNLAVAELSQDSLSVGVDLVQRLPALIKADEDRIVYTATLGLAEFRLGNIQAGRSLYEKTIQLAGPQRSRLAMIAAAFWAREERRCRSSFVTRAVEVFEALAKQHRSPEVAQLRRSMVEQG